VKRKDITDLIAANMWDRGHGNGCAYDSYLNGKRLHSYAQLKKNAQRGDKVAIEVYSSRGGWVKDTVSFLIEPDDCLVNYYRDFKQRNKKYTNRDYQRSKVYRWQQNIPRGKQLIQEQIEALVTEVYDDYGFPGQEPRIVVTRAKKSFSTYFSWKHEIRLAWGWGQRERVVLHELAHALLHTMKLDVPSHGKEFVALFIELCELYLDEDISIAKQRGVALGTKAEY
jgi:hypothetical protein